MFRFFNYSYTIRTIRIVRSEQHYSVFVFDHFSKTEYIRYSIHFQKPNIFSIRYSVQIYYSVQPSLPTRHDHATEKPRPRPLFSIIYHCMVNGHCPYSPQWSAQWSQPSKNFSPMVRSMVTAIKNCLQDIKDLRIYFAVYYNFHNFYSYIFIY